jgi:hypothetical protein
VRTELVAIDRELEGGTTLEVVVDSRRDDGLHDPALLERIDAVAERIRRSTGDLLPVSGILSINDVVKETNQALHGNDPAHYRIPSEREKLVQELFLFENSGADDLERLVDSRYRRARMSIKTPYADGVVYRDFVHRVEELLRSGLGDAADVTVTGGMALEARAIPKALESLTESYVSAFLVIGLLMVAFLGSLRLGLLSMIPNLLPIVAVMGLMGFLGLPLDMTTITVGSIGLGLAVDDTIHFMYNYAKYHQLTGEVRPAVERAFLGAGRAMMVTSLVLLAAFGVDVLASLSNVVRFGLLVSLIVIFALVADFLVTPALMRAIAARPRERLLARAAAVAVLAFAAAPASSWGLDARAIMERVESRDDGERVSMELGMTLVDRAGRTRERHARSLSQDREGGTDSILFFLEPPDVRGTGFLTHDHADPARTDDQWLFLPALGRTKRIGTSEKARSFMGSDFSYADLTRRSVERYDYRLMGEREVEGRPTWQIEAVPRDPDEAEETGYRRSIYFVRQDIDVVVRAVHWMRDSDDVKLLDVRRLEEIDGIWTPLEVEMKTMRGRDVEHTTILRNRDVRYDVDVPPDTFTPRRLERGP